MDPVLHDQNGSTESFTILSHGRQSSSSLSDKETSPTSPTDHDQVDLSFLTSKERARLSKVVKADLELKKATLEDVKRDIEKRKQFQTASNKDPRGTCACCGQVFRTFCDRYCAVQCQQCQHLICKLCKREQGGRVSCVLCIKERLYDLQCIGYLPVFQLRVVSYEGEHNSSDSNLVIGSDVLKLSLDAIAKRRVTFSWEESDIQLGTNKQISGTSEERMGNNGMLSNDAHENFGFELIKQATSGEDMIDLCSLYSEPCDPEDYDIRGEIKLGIWYKTEENTLYVRVVKARDLSAANENATSDPYVKIYLLPGTSKQIKKRTGIQRSTTKPEFNELLKYGSISQEMVKAKILWLSVWDWDRYGRNQFLGEVRLPLSSIDLTDSTDKWYTLQDMEDKDQSTSSGIRGKLLLSLMFEPSNEDNTKSTKERKGKLKIHIQEAEELRPDDLNAQINPFARCYLLPNKLIDSKRKTPAITNTLNPEWNSEIEYPHVSLEDLESSRVLEVTIWDRDRRGVNEFIGGIRLGPDPVVCNGSIEWMDSIGDEVTHWEAALTQPGEWVEQWHILRPSMSTLNQKTKRVSQNRPTPRAGELATSLTSLPSTDSESETLVTFPDSSGPHTWKDTLKSLSMKRPPRGNYAIHGEILVTVEYKDETLMVHIDRAVKIAAANKNGTSDSYVKTYLLTDRMKASKRKTEVQKRTVDPVYNTTFEYKVNSDQLPNQVIWITVWNLNKFSSNLFLGEACISMFTFIAANLNQPCKKVYNCKLVDFTITGIVVSESNSISEQELKEIGKTVQTENQSNLQEENIAHVVIDLT